MSFLTTDTKGDLYRNYAGIAKKYYGYETAVILLIAEFCPNEKRHIISVFKLIQDLLAHGAFQTEFVFGFRTGADTVF